MATAVESMATVVDVARHAGVSSATVSRVLNGNDTVQEEMRQRVHSAIRALEYRPNAMAQGLRKGHANTVALLVGDIAQRHFAELTLHIQTTLEDVGLDLLLINLGHRQERLTQFLARAPSLRLRGVVLALSDRISKATQQQILAARKEGLRLASVGQDLTALFVASIVHEERAAVQRSVAYLLEKGHRRIAYVGRIVGSAIGTERYRGYRAAMTAAGFSAKDLVWDMSYRFAAGRDAVCQAIDAGIAFTAIQAGSDEIAMGAIAALYDRRLRVPDDVAVIGFGDVEMGAYLRPALTTISTHADRAAHCLRELLATPLDRSSPVRATLLQRSLVVRASA
jgi:DNA-binding LacI/PurR family transcriptional regulator